MVLSFFLYTLPVIALLAAIVYLPWYLIVRLRHGRQTFLYHAFRYALTGYALSLLYLTVLWYYPFITFRPEYYFLNLVPFVWVREVYQMGVQKMIKQLLLNIGMFVPLGLLLPIAAPKLRRFIWTAAAVLGVTLLIETLQYFMGRSADIDDVLTNLAGGLIGYGLYALAGRLFQKRSWWQSASVRSDRAPAGRLAASAAPAAPAAPPRFEQKQDGARQNQSRRD